MAKLIILLVFNMLSLNAMNYQAELSLDIDQNKAFYGHSFRNFTGVTMENCLAHCLRNCLCLSFQICDDSPQCQLCSTNKYFKPQSLMAKKGCINYNFGNHKSIEVSKEQCVHSTIPICCIISNPCLNGGICLPPMSGTTKRFRCECPSGYKGDRCENCTSTSLLIKQKSVSNYVIHSENTPELRAITTCMWLKTNQTVNQIFFISYAVQYDDNAFGIYIRDGKPALIVANQHSQSNAVTQIGDGKWHHLCATWESNDGTHTLYNDGKIILNGVYSKRQPIPSGGTWVLTQDQDEVGGRFDEMQAFEGEMAEVNIFDNALSSKEIFDMSKICVQIQKGNVKSWDDFKSGVKGDIYKVPATCC